MARNDNFFYTTQSHTSLFDITLVLHRNYSKRAESCREKKNYIKIIEFTVISFVIYTERTASIVSEAVMACRLDPILFIFILKYAVGSVRASLPFY